MKQLFALVSLVIVLVLLSPATLEAQGANTIAYGDAVAGALADGAPLALYVFSGSANDVITARVIGASAGMSPTLTLLGPAQAVLQSSEKDAFLPGARAASIHYRLTQDGNYTLLVGGTAGDYVLTLNGRPSFAIASLSLDVPVRVSPVVEAPSQTFTVNADATRALSIEVTGSAPESNFVVELRDPDGRPVAILAGGLKSACLTVPAGNGQYELTIGAADATVEETFAVVLRQSECASGSPAQAAPVEQPPAQVQPDVQAGNFDVCTVIGAGNVNIRRGPGTDYEIAGVLFGGEPIEVYGQTGTGWYAVRGQGVEGFVAASVVSVYGPCANLPLVQAPANGPQPPAAPTLAPTVAQQEQPLVQPTATTPPPQEQPPVEPTATYTYTPTVEAQVAPPDANYVLDVPLGGNASVSDYVSYPGGDTEDRVSYDVLGLNSSVALPGGRGRLIITATCSGTGAEYVTFFTGGQTFTCGQTVLTREVNFDSKTGSVLISATGGDATYVQWTLYATAERLN